MGPQLCSCGNWSRLLRCYRLVRRFNGAATLQLRKLQDQAASDVLLMMLQWGRNFAVAETWVDVLGRRRTCPASMGPQLCSCGNSTPPVHATRGRPRFNGAATLQLRKHGAGRIVAVPVGRLQWGRNFAVAETRRRNRRDGRHRHASMGPQLCSCGNTTWGQWFEYTLCRLQWGRNFAVAETRYHILRGIQVVVASMGPQLCSCGNRAWTMPTRTRVCGFNGAATLQLRKLHIFSN